jgi:hypothetical protein
LQQVNDVNIAMAYTQQDAIQCAQEIARNTSDLNLFIIIADLIQNGQIWNTYSRIECVDDDTSKIQDRDEDQGFQKPLQVEYQVTLKSNCYPLL